MYFRRFPDGDGAFRPVGTAPGILFTQIPIVRDERIFSARRHSHMLVFPFSRSGRSFGFRSLGEPRGGPSHGRGAGRGRSRSVALGASFGLWLSLFDAFALSLFFRPLSSQGVRTLRGPCVARRHRTFRSRFRKHVLERPHGARKFARRLGRTFRVRSFPVRNGRFGTGARIFGRVDVRFAGRPGRVDVRR